MPEEPLKSRLKSSPLAFPSPFPRPSPCTPEARPPPSGGACPDRSYAALCLAAGRSGGLPRRAGGRQEPGVRGAAAGGRSREKWLCISYTSHSPSN